MQEVSSTSHLGWAFGPNEPVEGHMVWTESSRHVGAMSGIGALLLHEAPANKRWQPSLPTL